MTLRKNTRAEDLKSSLAKTNSEGGTDKRLANLLPKPAYANANGSGKEPRA